MTRDTDADRSERAAMFVDYENLYSVLTSQSSRDSKTGDYAAEILDEVRRYLEEGDDTPTIFGRAYGPFDVLLDTEDSGVPSNLHRLGIEPEYVPAAMQGNTSEVQLTIEVTRFLERRTDVQTVVLVTGDRPFLPLVRAIRESGCRALVAAVNPPKTDRYEESDLYLDARNLLSRESREDLLANAPENGQNYERQGQPSSKRYDSLSNSVARRAVAITEEHFGQYEEVYLTPLLRKLSDILGPDHDPKALVSELEAAGAVRLEKRSGYPYDYTVLIVHEDHPDVQDIREKTHASVSNSGPRPEPTPVTDSTESPESDEEYDSHDHDEFAIDKALSESEKSETVGEEPVAADQPDGTPTDDSELPPGER